MYQHRMETFCLAKGIKAKRGNCIWNRVFCVYFLHTTPSQQCWYKGWFLVYFKQQNLSRREKSKFHRKRKISTVYSTITFNNSKSVITVHKYLDYVLMLSHFAFFYHASFLSCSILSSALVTWLELGFVLLPKYLKQRGYRVVALRKRYSFFYK